MGLFIVAICLGISVSAAESHDLPTKVCADFQSASFPAVFHLWHDAIFTVPRKFKKKVSLSITASTLFSPVCALEANTWGLLTLFHYLELCGDPDSSGLEGTAGDDRRLLSRLAPRTLLPGEVACVASDDVCYVRVSPYANPCLELPREVLQSDSADIDVHKLQFVGYKPSTFGDINGVPLDEFPTLRPLEGFVASHHKLKGLWRHPAYALSGALVTFSSEPLVENKAFHYFVAAVLGECLFLTLALLVLYLCLSHLVRVSQQTAWGSFLYHSALMLPPVAAFFYRWLVEQLGAFLTLMFGFWTSGSCVLDPSGHCACSLCYEWIGKAYFGAGLLLGVSCEYSWRFFHYPAWRYEEQGWNLAKCGQRYLERFLGLLGLACFAMSFSSRDASLLLTLLLTKTVREQLAHWGFLVYLNERRSPYYAFGGKLQSQGEYEAEGKATTDKELAKLRLFVNEEHNRFLNGNGRSDSVGVLQRASFDEETMRRLDSFRLGGVDARRPNDKHGQFSGDDDDDGVSMGPLAKLRRLAQKAVVTLSVVALAGAVLVYALGSNTA